MKNDGPITQVDAELVNPLDPERLAHLAAQRGLIVRRALLVSAIRGFLPVPVMDDVLAGRVRAGLFQKLAAGRQVDLPPASAAILAESPADGAAAKMTLTTAATILARFAGRKFFAVLAAGRGADEMTRTFVKATLLDHYCAKMHVGGPITQVQATGLAEILAKQDSKALLGPLLAAFREGSRLLGRSVLEAPRWLSRTLNNLGERFARSGGNPDLLDATSLPNEGDPAWLDRAARAVEEALAREGSEVLLGIVRDFEERWQRAQEQAAPR